MIESGAFAEDDRLELIEGWVVRQTAKGPAHEYAVGQVDEALRSRIPEGWHVRNQAPITLASSEPEPDVTVVRGDRGGYRRHHPGADDVALVVEVSDTSLDTDRLEGKTYANAGIAAYWIVNLAERCVEVYTHPDPSNTGGYLDLARLGAGEELELRIDDAEPGRIPVALLLP